LLLCSSLLLVFSRIDELAIDLIMEEEFEHTLVSTSVENSLPRTLEMLRDGEGFYFRFIDQSKLPGEFSYIETKDYRVVIEAITTMKLRGAPALGIAGAAALALWVQKQVDIDSNVVEFNKEFPIICDEISNARPTAVNLSWGAHKFYEALQSLISEYTDIVSISPECSHLIIQKSFRIVKDMEIADELSNRAIGSFGSSLLGENSRVLTHCNAGSLATAYYGTALGVIYSAFEQGRIQHVYCDETRPIGQGARLTAWELCKSSVPTTLICDDVAASLMAKGEIDCVIVGADRIAKNGDVANKIGTYGLAVLAGYHRVPFYVCAPSSTIDISIENGDEIPIEKRESKEVISFEIENLSVYNPAFDVTPHELITAIITEKGVFAPERAALTLV